MQQRLVEQSGFDGKLASTEERDEIVKRNGERLATGSGEGAGIEAVELKAPEATRVDEAQFAARGEVQDGVGVRREWDVGGGDEQAAGHAEVDQALRVRRARFARRWSLRGRFGQVNHDVLADAVDAGDAQAGERGGHLMRRGFERFFIGGEPGGDDAVAADAAVDAVGYGFYFGELGHGQVWPTTFFRVAWSLSVSCPNGQLGVLRSGTALLLQNIDVGIVPAEITIELRRSPFIVVSRASIVLKRALFRKIPTRIRIDGMLTLRSSCRFVMARSLKLFYFGCE